MSAASSAGRESVLFFQVTVVRDYLTGLDIILKSPPQLINHKLRSDKAVRLCRLFF